MRIGINFLYSTFLVSVFFPPEVGRQYKHPLTKELELIQKMKDFALPLLIINTCLLNFEILIICALLSSTDQIVIVDKCGYVTKALLFIETIGWRRQPTIVCVFSECCLKICHKYSTQQFRIVLIRIFSSPKVKIFIKGDCLASEMSFFATKFYLTFKWKFKWKSKIFSIELNFSD